MSKPIPKSLHTVTVLVAMAKLIHATYGYNLRDCVTHALIELDYKDQDDQYGLIEQTMKKIAKV